MAGPSLSDADLDGRLPPALQAQVHRRWEVDDHTVRREAGRQEAVLPLEP
jgi:hypothetical protein